jgi:hypothetical protein
LTYGSPEVWTLGPKLQCCHLKREKKSKKKGRKVGRKEGRKRIAISGMLYPGYTGVDRLLLIRKSGIYAHLEAHLKMSISAMQLLEYKNVICTNKTILFDILLIYYLETFMLNLD